MTKTARVYRIEMLIKARGHVSFKELLEELEVSPATLKRDLEYLRDRLGAPIEYDRELNGYRLEQASRGPRHELPGLWFSERELHSLLVMHQLLNELDGQGTLSRHLQPLLDRVHEMLGANQAEAADVVRRVRIISPARRPVPAGLFERLGEALVQRQRLRMRYLTRGRGEMGEREVSPQRLVHYRHTWYLDAWCHRSEGLRRFALDAIAQAEATGTRAKEVPLRQVQAAMDAGYGIYAGAQRHWVTLQFAPQAAPWVSREQWHPEQQGRWLDDGRYELRVPYADPTELAMDILRHAGDVHVADDTGTVAAVVRARTERAWRALAPEAAAGGTAGVV